MTSWSLHSSDRRNAVIYYIRSLFYSLLRVLQFLVERTDAGNAHLGVLFEFKFEAHGHLFELLSFESKGIPNVWFAIKSGKYVGLLEDLRIVFFNFWNAIVECYDFGG